MRTAWKVLAGITILLVMAVAGIIVALSTMDVSALVGPVRDRVKAATGRELYIRGGASLELSLRPRVVLRDVALGNAAWSSAKDLVSARRLELQIALLPLLSRRFEVIELVLDEPVVALETDAKGRRNWDLESEGGKAGAPAAGESRDPAAIAVGRFRITNGTLSFRDGASGRTRHADIERLAVGTADAASPITFAFRGKVEGLILALDGMLGPIDALRQQRWPYPVSAKGDVGGRKVEVTAKVSADRHGFKLGDLSIAVGASALTGTLSVITDGPRPKWVFDLAGPALALTDLAWPRMTAAGTAPTGSAAAPATGAAKREGAWLIPDTPVDFAALRAIDAQGRIALQRLTLSSGTAIFALRAEIALEEGRLDLRGLSAGLWGGTIGGAVSVDARDHAAATLKITLDSSDLDLGAVLAAAGLPREVRGGKTRVTANLALTGASPHAWAQSATGTVLVSVGKATLPQTRVDFGPSLQELANTVNPFRATDPQTELECAVARLPIERGVARIDKSLAVETAKIGATASGSLDFGRETLDLAIHPKVRKGIPLDISHLAELVRVSGPFASPQVKVDVAGSAKALASIGAAIGTGGLSAVGQSLLSWTENQGPGPCAIALGARPGASVPAAPSNPAVPLANEIGKAVNRLFGK